MKYKNVMYGLNVNQKLDIIIPQKQGVPKETSLEVHAIVYIHGGAYLTGNKLQYPSFLADYSEENIFAAVDYRLIMADNNICMDDILCDINSALKRVSEFAKTNNVIIKDFILTGHSAGGHIALLYSYKYFNGMYKISACISMAGPADFTDDSAWSSMSMWGDDLQTRLSFMSQVGSRLIGKPIELTQSNWTEQKNYSQFKQLIMDISPVTYVSGIKKVPPTLLIHAKGDNQVPYSNAVRLIKALDRIYSKSAGNPSPHKLITPAGNADSHMLGGEVYSDYSPFVFKNQDWVHEAKKWMEAYLQ